MDKVSISVIAIIRLLGNNSSITNIVQSCLCRHHDNSYNAIIKFMVNVYVSKITIHLLQRLLTVTIIV